MPFKSIEKRREWDARYKREVQRPRAKARAAQAKEQARLHAEREAELRARSLVPMRLSEDLCFADHEHKRGETIWVIPGLVWQWEKRQLAVEIPKLVSYGVRVVSDLPPDRFEVEQHAPKERTAAGY